MLRFGWANNRYAGYLDKKGTKMGWLTPNFHTINSLYSFSGGTVLDFDDLSCVEVNVKFSVENVAAMFLEMWRLC